MNKTIIHLIFACLCLLASSSQAGDGQAIWLTNASGTASPSQGLPVEWDGELPYHWDKLNRGDEGKIKLDINFRIPETWQNQHLGVFIPTIGNAFEAYLNNQLIARQGVLDVHNLGDSTRLAKRFLLSVDLLQVQNQLTFIIKSDKGRRAGLSPVAIGPYANIDKLYNRTQFTNNTLIKFVALFSLLVGTLALVLWSFNQANIRDIRRWQLDLYFYAGIAEILWSIVIIYAIVETPPIPWPWWGILPVTAFALWLWGIAKFSMALGDWLNSNYDVWLSRCLIVLVISGPMVSLLAYQFGNGLMMTIWYLFATLVFLTLTVGIGHRAMKREAPVALRLIALALAINIAVAINDIMVFRFGSEYPPVLLLRYYSALFGLTLIYVLISRFREAVIHEKAYKQLIEERYLNQATQLSAQQKLALQLSNDKKASLAREKILRNLQDRIGLQLNNAISHLKHDSDHINLRKELTHCRDDITLSIDAINMSTGDINNILASIRYRLESRIRNAGISLSWNVEELPQMSRFTHQDIQLLQNIIVEAINNSVLHSKAQVLTLSANADDNGHIGHIHF